MKGTIADHQREDLLRGGSSQRISGSRPSVSEALQSFLDVVIFES